jgi:hypothetical protein
MPMKINEIEVDEQDVSNLHIVMLTLDLETQGKIKAGIPVANEQLFTVVCGSCNSDVPFDRLTTEPLEPADRPTFEYQITSIDGKKSDVITLAIAWKITGSSHRCWVSLDEGELTL